MLNRRFLRIKVMQALYAFFQHEGASPAHFEKELFKSLDKIHELYFTILGLIADIHHVALVVMDENKNKRMPGSDDLNPNMRFVENWLIKSIAESEDLKKEIARHRINWQNDQDLVRKLYLDIRNSVFFKEYMQTPQGTAEADRKFLISVVNGYLAENEVLTSYFEEKNIHWADDTFVAYNSVVRTLEETGAQFKIQPLLRDPQDDENFMSVLFNKTILYRQNLQDIIAKHTENWEMDRIANMDMLLMQMALAEVLYLPNVPVKASLNEYIDISKEYSSPNSKVFVNGVLDKSIAELKAAGKIQKSGRGLKED